MTITVAIDPGVNGCGLSVWDDQLLVMGCYTTGLGGQVNPVLEAVPHVKEVFEAIGRFDLLLIEVPQIYQQTSARKGDQRDLIRLALTCGAIMQAASTHCYSILELLPKDWKGQQDKVASDGTIIMERHMRATLMDEEIATIKLPKAKSLHHNVWDGVGIGAYRLGRKPLRQEIESCR